MLVALAFLAMFVKIIVPPGFMVRSEPAEFPLAICSGHLIERTSNRDAPADQKQHTDAPCAFAGHGVAGAPPLHIAVGSAEAAFSFSNPRGAHADLTPGHGLAAPPPPSHAPPILL